MRPLSVLLLFALASLPGCASKYYDARFAPTTTEAFANSAAVPGGQARSIVRIIGVRRRDTQSGAPVQVELRMRVENLGKLPCTLQQHSLQLLSGQLEPFGAAQLSSDDPPDVAPGASANFVVLFPLPEGRKGDDIDMISLNLRWAIAFDGEDVTIGVTFERMLPMNYDSTNFSVGIGFWGN